MSIQDSKITRRWSTIDSLLRRAIYNAESTLHDLESDGINFPVFTAGSTCDALELLHARLSELKLLIANELPDE